MSWYKAPLYGVRYLVCFFRFRDGLGVCAIAVDATVVALGVVFCCGIGDFSQSLCLARAKIWLELRRVDVCDRIRWSCD